MSGLGPLAADLARLAVEADRAVTLEAMEAMEALVAGRGRELLRGLVQLSLDGQAEREVRLAQVTGQDGVRRARAERGHDRPVVTQLGAVIVRRIAYRSGVKGAGSLFPRDAVLNLPPLGYSWALQRLAEMFCRAVSYEQAHEFVLAAAGVAIGKRQLEQITVAAAADAERFYRDRVRDQGAAAGAGEEEGSLPPLAISADGKGVAMRPEARRRRTRPRSRRCGPLTSGPGPGRRKGTSGWPRPGPSSTSPSRTTRPAPRSRSCARRAAPAGRSRRGRRTAGTPATSPPAGTSPPARSSPRPGRRDPGHARTWVALVDGDIYQLGLIQAAAAARGITLAILVDFIHVLEYLRKAAWCFHAPRDPAMEDWVSAQALDILHGRAAEVITRIAALAEDHPPKPGGEHAKIIRKTLHYLDARQPYLDYPAALAAGWPIATGVIEGACRHLVADRMGITGARWGLQGAQAILWLRAIAASGGTSAYRDWHIAQEHQRNHLSRYQPGFDLAA